MLCERCGKSEAVEHFSRITDASIDLADLCHSCFIAASGPVDLEEARRWLRIEAELGAAMDWSPLAREWFERATASRQTLPPEVAAFVRRWAPPSV